MKLFIYHIVLLLTACDVRAQGILYDQQSSADETAFPYGAGVNVQQASPYGQSFTPSFSNVNFIRLNLTDSNPNNSLGVSLALNLWADSMTGGLLASTDSITLANGFTGPVDFLFPAVVPLTPGATYVFQLVIQSGDLWNAAAGEYNYADGMVFYQGIATPASDLWFREGIVVPEPSTVGLMLLGVGLLGFRHWRQFRSETVD